MTKEHGRKANPFKLKRDSETLSYPEENRILIIELNERIETLYEEISLLKKELEKCRSK